MIKSASLAGDENFLVSAIHNRAKLTWPTGNEMEAVRRHWIGATVVDREPIVV